MPRIVFRVVDFPGRIPSEEADELTRVDVQLGVLEDVHLPVVGVDAREPEQRAVRRSSLALRRGRARGTPRRRAGFVATCSYVPSAIFSPWSRAITRSEIPSTTCMSCSMTRIV
jgi:hypothetical protein